MAKTEKRENYPAEVTERLVNEYQAGVSVDALAEAFGKSKRSVIAKLVREGVYVAQEKPKAAKRDEGPTKKELLRTLEDAAPQLPIEGFVNVTKEALTALIDFIQESRDAPAEDEAQAEAA